jgi:hypothetical protein
MHIHNIDQPRLTVVAGHTLQHLLFYFIIIIIIIIIYIYI